jgi:diadenosine tetraphosphate (Ap4A) HIT family hydrolase
MSAVPACELCAAGDPPAWREVAGDDRLRIVRVLDAPDFPAFYRVLWRAHVAELSDLSDGDRRHCLDAVVAVERALRAVLAPTKVNLATLGNVVPHLHWHVIARFAWDSHFPQPIWGTRQREPQPSAAERLGATMIKLDHSVRGAFAALGGLR